MNRCSRVLVPLLRHELSLANKAQQMIIPQRTFFSRRSSPFALVDVSRQFEDMERMFSRMERDMNAAFRDFGLRSPLRSLVDPVPVSASPMRFFPMVEAETTGDNGGKYILKMDVGADFNPENVKVSLKDRVLTVEAKFEQKSDDGRSRMYQEMSRSFTLPENVKLDEVKSLLTPEGILTIEAPLPQVEAPKPKQIPITTEP